MFQEISHLLHFHSRSPTPGSDITIHNVGINPTRSGIIDIVKQMGETLN